MDADGLVTAREDGFAVLVATWGGGLGAAAVVVDTPPPVVVTFRSGLIMQQTAGAHPFVAGRPVLARTIGTSTTRMVVVDTRGMSWRCPTST